MCILKEHKTRNIYLPMTVIFRYTECIPAANKQSQV